MREQAEALLEALDAAQATPPSALALFDADFHEGVVGIVASRLKDRLHRPTFVFARGQDGLLKGSGRSIPGFHLRDALDLVAKRHPGVLKRFGGHAMAAGCTLDEAQLGTFDAGLQQRRRRVARRGHPVAHAADRRTAGDGILQRRNGARARRPGLGLRRSSRRCSATRSRCCHSASSAKGT